MPLLKNTIIIMVFVEIIDYRRTVTISLFHGLIRRLADGALAADPFASPQCATAVQRGRTCVLNYRGRRRAQQGMPAKGHDGNIGDTATG